MNDLSVNGRSVAGAQLGDMLARFFERELSDQPNEIRERCSTCAFRPGTLPNQSAGTLMNALKCVVERDPFFCHEKGREGCHCVGYDVMTKKKSAPGKAFWDFIPAGERPTDTPPPAR